MGLMQALAAVEAGGYVNPFKAVGFLIILTIWARLLTWVDKDAKAAFLPRVGINSGMLGGLVIAVLLFLIMPNFWVGLLTLLFLFGLEAGVYLAMRNNKVGLGDLKQQFSDFISNIGRSNKEAKVAETNNLVQIIGRNGDLLPAPGPEDERRPAFDVLQEALVDPLTRGAEQVDITPVENVVVIRYVVDGVPYKGPAVERNTSGAMITLLKGYAGMDVNEKRRPQAGKVRVSVNGKRHELRVETAGTTAGESMRILVDPRGRHGFKIDDIGFTPDQIQKIQNVIAENSGVVLVASPKSMGMTAALYAIMRAHDAFLQHLLTLERDPPAELDGITQDMVPNVMPPGEEQKKMAWLISQEPDVIMIDRVDEPQTARELIAFASGSGKRVYVGIRAGSTFDAVSAWRKMVGDDRLAVSQLKMVVAGRVVRKLCSACKVGYAPDPNTLRKLNMDPGRVSKLFQARTQPMRNDKGQVVLCEFCHELYFKGRTGVFEVFLIDDEVRQQIVAGASLNQLKSAFRKQQAKYLQEQALQLVESGDTSVQEVLRVLKIGESPQQAMDGPASTRSGSITGSASGAQSSSSASGSSARIR